MRRYARRDFLKMSCITTAYILLPSKLQPGNQGRKRNVLFIAVDDLRPELGCYGADHIKSPNIDKLAARGTVFLQAYCQQAVCNPSRVSLLTGLRPDSAEVWDLSTHFRDKRPDVITLPQHFKNNGYHSQGMGKIFHVGHGNYDDKYSWSVPHYTPDIGRYRLSENQDIAKKNKVAVKKDKGGCITLGPPTEMADVKDNEYKDGATTELAIQTLRRIKDKPFFLAVGYAKPHLPFCAPKKYWDMYDPNDIKVPDKNPPENAPDFALNNMGEIKKYHGIPATFPLSDNLSRHLIHGYYACVSYVDALIGRILLELDNLGLRKSTSIVLWGDHGWKLGEYGTWCKKTNFELDTNSPLIVSDPDQKAPGEKTGVLVEFVDIYPTLCELCGLEQPYHLEGLSFSALLDNPKLQWKRAAFSQYPRGKNKTVMGYTMRTQRYRYTEWQDRKTESILARELYDHENDPREKKNIAGDTGNLNLLKELSQMLHNGYKKALPPE